MEDIFKDSVIKKEKLERAFDRLPQTVITGVVGANGPGAGKLPSDKYWSLNLSLIAWKELHGEINQSGLILSKNLTDDELKSFQGPIKKESLVQLRVKLSKDNPFGDVRAQLISVMDPPDDSGLQKILDKFLEPVEIIHPEFGALVLDRSVNWFEGTMKWLDTPIDISVSLHPDDNTPDASLSTLEALYRDAEDWSEKVTEYAVSNLLELKNDSWLMDDQTELTATEFIQAMKLEAIVVYPDGEFEFWHCDGDLFWGHSIQISGSLTQGLSGADIPG